MPLSESRSSCRIGSIRVEIEKRSAMLSAYTTVRTASTYQRSRGAAGPGAVSIIGCGGWIGEAFTDSRSSPARWTDSRRPPRRSTRVPAPPDRWERRWLRRCAAPAPRSPTHHRHR